MIKPVILLFVLSSSALAGPLPDSSLTPGVVRQISLSELCTTKWGKDHRAVTTSMKHEVFQAYGFKKDDKDPRCPCEIDHLVSRELGGADDVKNLWPQPYSGPWNAHDKDKLENRLHKEVCSGKMVLEVAQTAIKDWVNTYKRFFHDR